MNETNDLKPSIKKKIEIMREKLNKLVESGILNNDEIFAASCEMDELIIQYYSK